MAYSYYQEPQSYMSYDGNMWDQWGNYLGWNDPMLSVSNYDASYGYQAYDNSSYAGYADPSLYTSSYNTGCSYYPAYSYANPYLQTSNWDDGYSDAYSDG